VPETDIVPVVEPPAKVPPENDVLVGSSEPLPGVYVPPVMYIVPATLTPPEPPVKLPLFRVKSLLVVKVPPPAVNPPDVFPSVKVAALMVAEALELAVNVKEPEVCRLVVTTTAPLFEPPAHDPADSDIAFAVS
jgi:hypothetical protein